jgi:hypothetical protein
MGVPPPELVPPPAGRPPTQPGHIERCKCSKREDVVGGYVYIPTALHCAECCIHEVYAQHCNCDNDFIPDMLTDVEPSTS